MARLAAVQLLAALHGRQRRRLGPDHEVEGPERLQDARDDARRREAGRAAGGGGEPARAAADHLHPPLQLDLRQSEKAAKLAQKLGQLQPSIAAFQQECMAQLASFGPT